MNLSEIKRLVNDASLENLKASEEALYNEESLPIEVNGVDEGEKLTHVLAAIWIKNEMDKTGEPLPKVLRNYTAKVRKSIS
jgi:hypothetical protein